MSRETDELERVLKSRLADSQSPVSPKHEAHETITMLTGSVADWELGDYSMAELQEIEKEYPVPGFSLMDWMKQTYD